ncbi:MAG: OprO/OprP family phosphate-selective porin [Reichenbachiella sp.]
MRSKHLLALLLFCLTSITTFSQSFEGSKIGKGLKFIPQDSSFSLQFNTRFQTQYVGVQNLETDQFNSAFTIRRFRLKFKGHLVDPRIQYKMELALSNRDQGDFYAEQNGAASIVLDAVLKWKFHPNFALWVGQTKLPGNRERVISSGALQLVDRSRLNSRYNIDRDKGVQLHAYQNIGGMVLREAFSISSGEGRNVTLSDDSGFDYTSRIELLPFGKFKNKGDYFGADLARETTPKLAIGITYDHNFGTNRQRGQLGSFVYDADGNEQRSDLSTVFIDTYFKYNGFSVMYEYANKKVASGATYGLSSTGSDITFYTGEAHNIQGGYIFKSNYSIDGRFTNNKPTQNVFNNTDGNSINVDDPEKRYEIGITKYIAGHTLKVQTSIVYRDRLTKSDEMMYFAQLEIGF